MKERLPDVTRVVRPDRPDGVYTFETPLREDCKFFVIVIVPKQLDEFAVEVGWARDADTFHRTRLCNPREAVRTLDQTKTSLKEACRFRLSQLWGDRDRLWVVSPRLSDADLEEEFRRVCEGLPSNRPPVEEGLQRIPTLVEEIIDRIVDTGIPFVQSALTRTEKGGNVSDEKPEDHG